MRKTSPATNQITTVLDGIAKMSFLFALFAFAISKPAPILIGAYLALGSWVCSRMIRNLPPIPKTELNFYILLIAATLLLSIVLNGDWHEGFRGLNKWIRGLLIFWFSYDFFQNSKNEKNTVLIFSLIFIIVCINGIFQYVTGKDFIWGNPVGFISSGITRVTSSFGYFGMFACFLIMVLPVTVILTVQQPPKRISAGLFPLFFVFGCLNLYLTRSRGAWIAFVGMCVLFLLFQKKWWLSILVVAGLLAAPFALPKDLIFHHREEVGIDKTINHRIVLWNQALNILKANPIVGCGLNTYVKNIRKYNSSDYYEVSNYYAHNGYLQHAAETGSLGLLAFLLLIVRYYSVTVLNYLSAGRDNRFKQLMILLSVSGFLFYMFFDTIFHNLQPFLLFWIFLGWGLAINQQEAGVK